MARGPGCPSVKRGRGGLAAWLELGRVSNLPTVVSNGVVGCALGWSAGSSPALGALAIAILCVMYTFGMVLNDVFDHAVDARERPSRPIPSGRVALGAARSGAYVLCGVALAASLLLGAAAFGAALVLAALIVAYNKLHQSGGAASLLMAGCRAMCYVLPFAAVGGGAVLDAVVLPIALLFCYILCVTLVARSEVERAASLVRVAFGSLAAVIGLLPFLLVGSGVGAAWAMVLALMLYSNALIPLLRTPQKTTAAVLMFLALICALDASILLATGWEQLAAVPVLCYILTRQAHARIPGT